MEPPINVQATKSFLWLIIATPIWNDLGKVPGAVCWIVVLNSTPAEIEQLIPWLVQKSALKVPNNLGKRLLESKNTALKMEPGEISPFSFPETLKVKGDPGTIGLGETVTLSWPAFTGHSPEDVGSNWRGWCGMA